MENFKSRIFQALRAEGFTVHIDRMRPDYLNRYAFDVQTNIDVGVFKGTPFFYDSVPDSEIILIDPLPEAAMVAETLSDRRDVKYFSYVAGAEDGELTLNRPKTFGAKGSLHERTRLTAER